MKPYVYGHRGAMGYHTENTIESFKASVKMKAGIESDIRLTKDKILICFHDPAIEIDGRLIRIKKLSYKKLKAIKLQENVNIPKLSDIFAIFAKNSNLKYSFDIGSSKVGAKVIDLAKQYQILKNVLITDSRLSVLKRLRKYDSTIELVHTLPHYLTQIKANFVDFIELHNIKVKAINIQNSRYLKENFQKIVDHGFDCFVWGVNTRLRMRKVLNLHHKNKKVKAIYSDYPDRLIQLRNN